MKKMILIAYLLTGTAMAAELVDPNQAPEAIRSRVKQGYQLVLHTHRLLPEYAGDRLDCTNCHFAGGNTTGGTNGGISLAGSSAKYATTNALKARINKCFIDSMNGKALPEDSQDMQSIIAYLNWISTGNENAPWLGIKPIKSTHKPDPENGKKLYMEYCSDCHGADGDGGNKQIGHAGRSIPPVFGKNSYNTSAGMNNLQTFASFIYDNMPIGDPHLTVEEALDIAAFVHAQPRPKKE